MAAVGTGPTVVSRNGLRPGATQQLPPVDARGLSRLQPSALFEALHALIGQRVPLHIWGACGVGKSQIVAQVASDLNWQFLDVRALQLDPVDLRGLPRIAADQAEWVPPKFLPTSGQGILFLRAHLRSADDTGRLLSAGARSQTRRISSA